MEPNAIFSPSLARQQSAIAKDWSYIDGWLASKFSNTTPPFERNPETLKALLALAAHNESADEQADLLAKVQAKALRELREEAEACPEPEAGLLAELESSLSCDGRQALEDIASLSVGLGTNSVDPEELGTQIITLTESLFTLSQHSQHVSSLQSAFETELEHLRRSLTEIESSPTLNPPPKTKTPTPDYPRLTKHLTAKLREYNDRLGALGLTTPSTSTANLPTTSSSSSSARAAASITIPALKTHEAETAQQIAQVATLEARVAAFRGLPHAKRDAVREVENAGRELDRLRRERDGLFEGLVEGGR
ncbi:MAG: hypothetical protein M1837_004912 [Sclerophora amabilis]|nr:MAG: hypothetical protein M1837_004912 [Sclerophora amabilis]